MGFEFTQISEDEKTLKNTFVFDEPYRMGIFFDEEMECALLIAETISRRVMIPFKPKDGNKGELIDTMTEFIDKIAEWTVNEPE